MVTQSGEKQSGCGCAGSEMSSLGVGADLRLGPCTQRGPWQRRAGCETRPLMQSARAGLEVLGPPPGTAAKDASDA